MKTLSLEKSHFFEKVDNSSKQTTRLSNVDATSFVTNKQLEKEHNTLRAEIQSLREELQTLEKKFHQGNKDKNFKYSNTKTYL